MLHLTLSIASSVLIAVILRMSEDRGGDRFTVAGTNYMIAALLSLVVAPSSVTISSGEAAFAVAVGLGFVGGFLALMRAIREIGLAVPATAARLSTLVPVIGSVALYDEIPSAVQIAGIAVGIVAFIVLGAARRGRRSESGIGGRGIRLLVAVFAIAGCVDFALKVAHESGAARGPFLVVVFLTAAAICSAGVIARRHRPRRLDLVLGTALGVANFGATYFLLRALESLAGVVVFPATNASVVLGVTVVAMLFWREIPTAVTAAGLGLAAAAVVLLGLG